MAASVEFAGPGAPAISGRPDSNSERPRSKKIVWAWRDPAELLGDRGLSLVNIDPLLVANGLAPQLAGPRAPAIARLSLSSPHAPCAGELAQLWVITLRRMPGCRLLQHHQGRGRERPLCPAGATKWKTSPKARERWRRLSPPVDNSSLPKWKPHRRREHREIIPPARAVWCNRDRPYYGGWRSAQLTLPLEIFAKKKLSGR